jgi:hypothetical protein
MNNNIEQKRTEIWVFLLFLPLYIVNIIYGVKNLDTNCTEPVGSIVYDLPVWLIVVGSCGCLKFICSFLYLKQIVNTLSFNEFVWFIIGNILFWNGTQNCSGELYNLGLANMIIGYISIFLGIGFWIKNQNKEIQGPIRIV